MVHAALLPDELLDGVGSDDGSHHVAFVRAGVFFLHGLLPSARNRGTVNQG